MSLGGVNVTDLPTNYGYYTSGGIQQGLTADKPNFYLNNKEIFVYSGAMHYFRVPRAYWRDRLRKMRAAGLNTVETYIPWNLHEPKAGEYDFGDGGNDMTDFLNLQEFLKIAQEEDLFAIIRSGPYICSEFEFGGHPSWLLRDDTIEVRTTSPSYVKHVTNFFNVLLPILAALQFTKGGSIIMFQVENEYSISGKHDLEYLKVLKQLMTDNGIVELLVTADNPDRGTYGTLPDLFLMTGNFGSDIKTNLDLLKQMQPTRPTLAMEFWSGVSDYWGDKRNSHSEADFLNNYEEILKYPSSVNIYMFHGGTNFGFLNGATNLKFDDWETDYHSLVSSYDFIASLDESGDYTDKYWKIKDLLEKYNPVKTAPPSAPASTPKTAYASVKMEKELFLYDMLLTINPVTSTNVVAMEKLDVNNGNGQSFGYVVYRKTNLDIPANGVLKIEGRICDTAMVLINGILISPWLQKSADLDAGFGTSRTLDSTLVLTNEAINGATLDIVVENWGRVNVGVYKQFKGIWQGNGIKLNDEYIHDWTIYPLEFKSAWTNNLSDWRDIVSNSVGPAMYKGNLQISGNPEDTFVYMEKWIKGIVIVNGLVIGRYARMGPIQTLYLPAPLLRQGNNEIVVFEHFQPSDTVDFINQHVYNSY